jgi:carbonic anhydrase
MKAAYKLLRKTIIQDEILKGGTKLFLICPDCHLENIIKKHFEGELFFLTALGSVFNTSSAEYAAGITRFLAKENVREIIIVNDSSCRFIHSVLNNNEGYKTKAEEVLEVIHSNCQIEILKEKKSGRSASKLAELNILQQADSLKETIFIGKKISKKNIVLRGMIYERGRNVFTEVAIQ